MASSDRDTPTPSDQVAALYEQLESQAAQASEHMVGTRGFAALLGQLAENTAALSKLGNDAMDLVLRNLRLAGRRDVVRLARQLARTEDKLERVLQELETLRDQLNATETRPPAGAPARRAPGGRGARRSNGAPARQGKSSQ
jgi:ABC-type transporter Mla subunit MlaD